MIYQQGDVILENIAQIEGKKLAHLVLARGETTGHCHQITEGEAELYERDGVLFLGVRSEEAVLTHEEHMPITLPRGNFKVRKVREYDHFAEEAREVQD